VFSYGIVLWEIAHRQIPYSGSSLPIIRQCVMEGQRLPIEESVPEAFGKLVEMCWDKTPQSRPSFLKIIDYIESNMPTSNALASSPSSSSPSSPSPSLSSSSSTSSSNLISSEKTQDVAHLHLKTPVKEWKVDDVCEWLRQLKVFHEYIPNFQNNHVDGEMLGDINDEDVKSMISKHMHAKKFMKELEALKECERKVQEELAEKEKKINEEKKKKDEAIALEEKKKKEEEEAREKEKKKPRN